jgi:hypothetical protein
MKRIKTHSGIGDTAVVLFWSAARPIAVLSTPVVLPKSAALPKA